jgi:DNA topoisomerase VI subunit B
MRAAATSLKQGSIVAVREHFSVSRAMEYFSEAELVRQSGHTPDEWPLMLVKEAVENGLDGAESASIPPRIEITVDGELLTVSDNGPGLAPGIVKRICDFNSRTSDKSSYVSPTRGQMGNGAKLLLAVPFILAGSQATVIIIEACGIRHTITIDINELLREPRIIRQQERIVKTAGTKILIPANSASSQEAYQSSDFLQLVASFALFNPHAEFSVRRFGERYALPASLPKVPKWSSATQVARWYDVESFGNLIRSQIADDEVKHKKITLREFIAVKFRGLSGSTKPAQICSAAGLTGEYLVNLLDDQQRLRQEAIERLLGAMKEASAPVKAEQLGILGEAHFRASLSGGNGPNFRYKRSTGEASGLPFIVEAAFSSGDSCSGLQVGINHSVPLRNPLQQTDLGGEYGLAALFTKLLVDVDEVNLALHLCCPRFAFIDQGKSNLRLPQPFREAVAAAVTNVTANWTRFQKKLEKSQQAAEREQRRQLRTVGDGFITLVEAAEQVMEAAYLKARGPVQAPVRPRQIMYVARKDLERLSGQTLRSDYFSQTLLIGFMRAHPDLTKDWQINWDERGHFEEPHGGVRIGIGTEAVREYLARRKPDSFGAILVSEKEGFDGSFKAYRLQERWDLGIMSSKGMNTTSARKLIEALAGENVKIFCLHDFDISGMTILSTSSRDTKRYEFERTPEVIDMGLRLSDVREMGLESEAVEIDSDPTNRLHRDGATEEEIAFLRGTLGWSTKDGKRRYQSQRVELNAMTNPQLIEFIERKLQAHGVTKIIPDEDRLGMVFRATVHVAKVAERMRKAEASVEAEVREEMKNFEPPDRLHELVEGEFRRDAYQSWRDAIYTLATTNRGETERSAFNSAIESRRHRRRK